VYRRTAVIRVASAIFGFKLLMASTEILAILTNRLGWLRERLPRTALADEVIEVIASATGGGWCGGASSRRGAFLRNGRYQQTFGVKKQARAEAIAHIGLTPQDDVRRGRLRIVLPVARRAREASPYSETSSPPNLLSAPPRSGGRLGGIFNSCLVLSRMSSRMGALAVGSRPSSEGSRLTEAKASVSQG
jgi:hypothetical protein